MFAIYFCDIYSTSKESDYLRHTILLVNAYVLSWIR